MTKYVDGYVLVVPNDKTEEYKKIAEQGRDLWMRLGAIGYYECRGDDLVAKDMGGEKAREFPEMADAKDDETVWFSYIIFRSKEQRDEINQRMIEEMNMKAEENGEMSMPFDMQRMAYGGFVVEVEG